MTGEEGVAQYAVVVNVDDLVSGFIQHLRFLLFDCSMIILGFHFLHL